ncbi:TNF receptor-associated factor 6-like isoform X2 [Prorops nasuta]|uniref:TNF receptor-associated factor 6-like isoform X2 n=1 Tax=Prorops nasuta TaxID=863751 RepID=UPI0034CD94A8
MEKNSASHSKEVNTAAEESRIHDENVKSDLESRYECPICLTWLQDPVLTKCGHKFCYKCIFTWMEKEGPRCPVDDQTLDEERDLFRDRCTTREMSQQRTNCPYNKSGCTAKLFLVDMENHVKECTYKENPCEKQNILCPFQKLGCFEVFSTEELSLCHLDTCINKHLTMMYNVLTKLPLHQSEINPVAIESKLWNPPPKDTSKGISQNNLPSEECQQLLQNLYERIVVLEQENRELSIIVSNQKNQLTTLQTLIPFNHEEMLLHNCNGIYIWRLKLFEEKLVTMINDPLKMFYSPGFYTSTNGYKLCARINISSKNSDFLSLLLHIMKSENDDALDWPFNVT